MHEFCLSGVFCKYNLCLLGFPKTKDFSKVPVCKTTEDTCNATKRKKEEKNDKIAEDYVDRLNADVFDFVIGYVLSLGLC